MGDSNETVRTIVRHLIHPDVRTQLAKHLAESPSTRVLFEYLLTEYIEACGQERGEQAVMSAFVAVLRRREGKFQLMQRQACDYETALSLAVGKRKFKGRVGQTIRKRLTPWVASQRTFCNPNGWEKVLNEQMEKEEVQ